MRILAVYRGLPWPILEGYHLRVLHLFRRIARRHEVHLLALINDPAQEARRAELEAEGPFASLRVERFPPRSAWGRLRTNSGIGAVAALKAEYPGFPARLRGVMAELVADPGVEVAYAFDPWATVLLSDALLVPALLDVCDSRTLYYERRLAGGGMGLGGRLRTRQLRCRFAQYERYLLATYPLAAAVSEPDCKRLLALRPGARVETIPNGVDLEMFAPVEGVAEEPGRLILFGNMDFWPNVDAACHFAREVLPLVRERRPEARFVAAGTNPAPEVLALRAIDGVEVPGEVPDLRPWITRSSMLVAPLRFGAGIKNKLLETLACERPVVTTSLAAEGVHPEIGALLRIADEPRAFADAVVELLEDDAERRRIGVAGRRVLARVHSWDAAAARYEALLEELRARAERSGPRALATLGATARTCR